MTITDRWNPRRRLSTAIGLVVFALVALSALLAANLAADQARRRAEDDAVALLSELATQSQEMLAARLHTHRLLVRVAADQITASNDRGASALRRHLGALQAQFPEFVWLGVTDADGLVMAGTGGQLQGTDMSAAPWFSRGRGDLQPSDLPVPVPPALAAADGARAIAISVPLAGNAGRQVGVVAAYLSWSWLQSLQKEMLGALGAPRQLEVILTAQDGTVLSGPAGWIGRPAGPDADLSEGGRFLVGRSAERPAADDGVAWAETVRQPTLAALTPAHDAQRAVFVVVLLAGLLAATLAVLVTQLLMRRLSELATQAEAVRRGDQSALQVPGGADEVTRIGAALAELVEHLQQEKQALLTLNRELDARVAERTARIEQLADDARHAAVTRDRLRMARDLHDTLAHSLMALLTQIRLIRKLQPQLDAATLDAELGRAEAVTTSGLGDARAAITQMRSSGVRDAGLGASLKELVDRFAERTGVAVDFSADPDAANQADERAETALRVAGEALRNVERHAQARHVRVALRWQARPGVPDAGTAQVSLTLIDDGVGFEPALPHGDHYGLQGMHEQAALIGARLEVHSQPGQSTRIALSYDA